MKRPSKAVVLCAGLGTRMDPLSRVRPKPLMPLWGKPFLDHTLDLLASWGVREVLINLHHGASALLNHCAKRDSGQPQLNLSFEPRILGTGGALLRAKWFFDDAPLWIVNGDIALDLSPTALLAAYQATRPSAVLWLHPTAGPRTVEAHNGRITCFRSAHPGVPGTFTFCGLQLVSPALLQRLPQANFFTLVDLYESACKRSETVCGVCVARSFWADMGTPASYLDAHARTLEAYRKTRPGSRLVDPDAVARVLDLKRAGFSVDGFVAIGAGVSVGSGAKFHNSVIWDNVIIGSGVNIRNGIVADNTCVSGRVRGAAVPAEPAGDSVTRDVIDSLGWNPGKTAILPLKPRGSDRTFTRIRAGNRSAILVRFGAERAENALYVRHARFLSRLGLRVPRIRLEHREARLCVIEDLGDNTLQEAARKGLTARVRRIYRETLVATARLHAKGLSRADACDLPLNPPFGKALYRWERELFQQHLIPLYPHLSNALIREAMRDIEAVSCRLQSEPKVLLHRDLQSSNVMIAGGHPAFIDFQGMRKGPAVYDLASLLYDPYVSLSEPLRCSLLAHYADCIGCPPDSLEPAFRYGAVQRLIQALGAYGRLGASPETRRFLQYIAPALDGLQQALTYLDKPKHLLHLVCTLKEEHLCACE